MRPTRPHGDRRPLTDAHKDLIRLLARAAVTKFLNEDSEAEDRQGYASGQTERSAGQ